MNSHLHAHPVQDRHTDTGARGKTMHTILTVFECHLAIDQCKNNHRLLNRLLLVRTPSVMWILELSFMDDIKYSLDILGAIVPLL